MKDYFKWMKSQEYLNAFHMLVIYVLYGQTTRVYAGFKGGFYQNFDLKLK